MPAVAALIALPASGLLAGQSADKRQDRPAEATKTIDGDASEAVDLLAKDDLSAWVEEQHGFFKERHKNVHTWSVKDGVLACDGSYGNCGFLRYKEKLGDFRLTLEYRTAKRCNSGVCIRSRVPYTTLKPNTLPSHVGFEVQILDDAGKPADEHSSGAFYGVLAPKLSAARPAGQWNTLEITCRGPKIRVVLNGQTVQDADQTQVPKMAGRPLAGYLSFQNHGGNAEFRKMRLTVLKD